MAKLLNTFDAARITGYSRTHIRELVRIGRLKCVRVSPYAQMRFREEDLMNLTQAPKLYPEYKEPKK